VTWVKLSDDFAERAARSGLSDAAFRTHIEALLWTMRRETGGWIRTRDIQRFAETSDPDAAVRELVGLGWWHYPYADDRYPDDDRDPDEFRIVANMDDQPEPEVIEARRRKATERVRKHRRKMAGLDPECSDERSPERRNGVTERVTRVGSGRVGSGTSSVGTVLRLNVHGRVNADAVNSSGSSTPSQTRKRVHDGPANDGPGVQHDSTEVQRQSQATDRYAREAVRQAVLDLRAEGLSFRQIAAKAGCSPAYAHKIVHAAESAP
jgi:hypothetical protein